MLFIVLLHATLLRKYIFAPNPQLINNNWPQTIICTSFVIAKKNFPQAWSAKYVPEYPFESKFLYGCFKTGNNHLHSIIVKLPQFIGRTSFHSKVGCNSLIIILSSLQGRINYTLNELGKVQSFRNLDYCSLHHQCCQL